ncbi:uncharacterized protein HMPREF1541_03832 [Cyphellophora europaea CBS 101466]|uniref:DUF1772 domain-containing protein n=1 Tax=Cyphellophora europaea (strain CBS 101466) TaxID=1220924 RepID=W2S1I5_CYPE1|nr:uncharacterized protein HMPREF1541_03832 [Cyphellophora europaea CBS 101466]ETN41893.1 hypothetical protein HMPREF1541_03832 [Cyphellophora europaea CBS 101466]
MDSRTATTSLQAIGITCALLHSGISAGSSLLTLPILQRLPAGTALDIWTEFFDRGLAVVVPLAIASTVASATAAYLTPPKRNTLAAAGGLVISTLIWTALVMAPGIQRMILLNDSAAELEKAAAGEVLALLKAWSWQNMVRFALSGAGGVVGLWALVQSE